MWKIIYIYQWLIQAISALGLTVRHKIKVLNKSEKLRFTNIKYQYQVWAKILNLYAIYILQNTSEISIKSLKSIGQVKVRTALDIEHPPPPPSSPLYLSKEEVLKQIIGKH